MRQKRLTVRYDLVDVADCTCDPHPVSYKNIQCTKARLQVMFADIIKVCESDMVKFVRSVGGKIGVVEYESDHYTEFKRRSQEGKTVEPAKGEFAEKHKTAGAFFFCDAEPDHLHLPPGLTGLKYFIKEALCTPNKFKGLTVGVTWTFAGDSSCSDYIKLGEDSEVFGQLEGVEYNSQDYWINNKGYLDWCKRMASILGRDFQHADPKVL